MVKIKKANEIEIPETVVGLIYGQPGAGKTTLSVSALKPVLIDTEGGVHRIESRHRCDTLQVENWNDILNNLPFFKNYETIIFDTINEVLIHIEKNLVDTTPKAHFQGKLNQYGYGLRSLEFKNLINKIKFLKKNIIFIAHDIESKDDNNNKECRPDISGKASGELMKFMDFVGYLEMLGTKRIISFMPSSKFYAKNSLGLESYITLPNVNDKENNFITEQIIKPTIEKRKKEQAAGLKGKEKEKEKEVQKTSEELEEKIEYMDENQAKEFIEIIGAEEVKAFMKEKGYKKMSEIPVTEYIEKVLPSEKKPEPRNINPDLEKQINTDLAAQLLIKIKEKGITKSKDIILFCQEYAISSKDSETFMIYLEDDKKLDALVTDFNNKQKTKAA
ncbi:MAG: ATP-binding protein [Patescibacteria group bacterium]|nr:ATP-binding protein [Patescibacteria group bacterium]